MRKPMTALAAVFVFTACDGNPFETGTSTTTTTTTTAGAGITIPDTLANNLSSVTYDPVAKTLSVAIAGIDGTPVDVPYTRNLAAEAGLPAGYEAYSIQEDALDRLFIGVVRQSADGSVRAAMVSDGGQFNRFFYGGVYDRTGEFTPPTVGSGPGAGQVSYAGGYVGLDNYSGPYPALPAGADPALQMQAPGRVAGSAFINANFSDMKVNGSVFNRTHLDSAALPPLVDLVLISSDIADDGTFFGNVELIGGVDVDIGDYGGIFGGADASSVGAVLTISNFEPTIEGEVENGVLVLTQCGKPGEDVTLCAGTAP